MSGDGALSKGYLPHGRSGEVEFPRAPIRTYPAISGVDFGVTMAETTPVVTYLSSSNRRVSRRNRQVKVGHSVVVRHFGNKRGPCRPVGRTNGDEVITCSCGKVVP